jgi:hypothetical protein
MPFLTVMFTICPILVITRNHSTLSLHTPALPLPFLNEPTIQDTQDGDEISSTSPNSNIPTIQETPDGDIRTIQETPEDDESSIAPPYFNALPIQETPDGDQIATSSERNISP